MSRRLLAHALLSGIGTILGIGVRPAAGEIPTDDTCVTCHAEEASSFDVALFFLTDVHGRAGLSCADCHGGDPTAEDEEEAMSEDAGFVGAPGPLEIPEFCGRCHADPEYMRRFAPNLPVDQLELYHSSLHGQKNLAGDRKVATCVNCHRTHDIRPASEPKSSVHPQQIAATCGRCHADEKLMSSYGIPHNQVSLYMDSVHGRSLASGRDLSSPTCNDCHGDHGALPPDVGSIFSVCGHCHVHNRELYRGSAKHAIFEDLGESGCVTCHGNHLVQHPTEEMLSLEGGSLCADCHDDDGSEASTTILGMRSALDSLRTAVEGAESHLVQAEQRGMYMGGSSFDLRESHQALFRARTEVHRFDESAVRQICREGVASAESVAQEALGALDEYRFRRNGLAVASLVISLFALSLYGKIRAIDRRTAAERSEAAP